MLSGGTFGWVLFGTLVAGALAVDLGIFHRKAHDITFRQALIESSLWIALALSFNLWVYVSRGREAGLSFLTSYLVEKSMSVDNIFVFVVIFQSIRLPPKWHHKVLFYGVLGALATRLIFIIAGVELMKKFHPVLFVFGGLLVLTGLRMLLPGRRVVQPEKNWMVRIARRIVPVADPYEGGNFWVRRQGRWNATPLFLALIAIEAMDILFAMDSVPAVLAITRDFFIVYSSNAFAVLGLRALYFLLADALPRLRFLHQGLAVIVIFVGGKMLATDWMPISTAVSLAVIAGVLALTATMSRAIPDARPKPAS